VYNPKVIERISGAAGSKQEGSTMTVSVRRDEIPSGMLEKWQDVVDVTAEVLDVPAAFVIRIDPPLLEVLLASNTSANPVPAGEKMNQARHYCESVVRTRSPLTINYAPDQPPFDQAPEIEAGLLAYLGYPLFWPTGEIFGTICVLDTERNEFGDRYEKVLARFKDLIEGNLALFDSLRRLEAKNEELEKALAEIRTLRGIIPICAGCKSIRDDDGLWREVDRYVEEHSEAVFSHSLCPECRCRLYPEC
jgi:GAF domain-containing protein